MLKKQNWCENIQLPKPFYPGFENPEIFFPNWEKIKQARREINRRKCAKESQQVWKTHPYPEALGWGDWNEEERSHKKEPTRLIWSFGPKIHFAALRHRDVRGASVGDPYIPCPHWDNTNSYILGNLFCSLRLHQQISKGGPAALHSKGSDKLPFEPQSTKVGQGMYAKPKQGDFLFKSKL